MVDQHSMGIGGILGDEMGLGKTLQVPDPGGQAQLYLCDEGGEGGKGEGGREEEARTEEGGLCVAGAGLCGACH
eukprot:1944419-Rhodomonas_salina.3